MQVLSPTLDIWINTKHLVVRKALEGLAISDGNYMGITDCFRGCKVNLYSLMAIVYIQIHNSHEAKILGSNHVLKMPFLGTVEQLSTTVSQC